MERGDIITDATGKRWIVETMRDSGWVSAIPCRRDLSPALGKRAEIHRSNIMLRTPRRWLSGKA